MLETFNISSIDWGAILKIIGIDIMLGVDNAIVIALACAGLPVALRKKAVIIGTIGAVGLRIALLAVAGLLMSLVLVKLIAGVYLVYIGIKLLLDNSDSGHHSLGGDTTIGSAVKTIIIADFMMSLDNVLAVVGASQSAGAHSTFYAVAGIVISIPIIVFGAQGIMKLMDRFPVILWIGAGLLGWVGAEMILSEPLLAGATASLHNVWVHAAIKAASFVLVIATVLIIQKIRKKLHS